MRAEGERVNRILYLCMVAFMLVACRPGQKLELDTPEDQPAGLTATESSAENPPTLEEQKRALAIWLADYIHFSTREDYCDVDIQQGSKLIVFLESSEEVGHPAARQGSRWPSGSPLMMWDGSDTGETPQLIDAVFFDESLNSDWDKVCRFALDNLASKRATAFLCVSDPGSSTCFTYQLLKTAAQWQVDSYDRTFHLTMLPMPEVTLVVPTPTP